MNARSIQSAQPQRQQRSARGSRAVAAADSAPAMGGRLHRWAWPALAAVVAAVGVRMWESDWKLERQAAHASLGEIRALAERLPNCEVVEYHLGRNMAAIGDLNGAVTALEKARAANPGSGRVVTLLSDVLERQARFSDAGALTEGFVRSHDNSGEAHFALGVYLFRVFARPQAVAELNAAVRLAPNDARAWRVLGEAHLSLNQFPEAVESFTKALMIEPEDSQTLIRRGTAYAAESDPARAERDMRAALRAAPTSAEARFALAELLAKHGIGRQPQREAENLFRSTLSDSAKSADSHRELGRLLSLQSRWNEAAAELAIYTKDRPEDPTGLYLYATALRRLGEPADSVMTRFRAVKSVEETRRDLLGKVQAQPNDVGLRLHLARFLAAHDERALAIVCYERAIRSDPKNETARRELASIQPSVNDIAGRR